LNDWKFTSFASFFTNKPSSIKREEVLEWFGDSKANFYNFHLREIDEKMTDELEFL